jgi:toxin YhaV
MVVNGWSLYSHPLFEDQLNRLIARVEQLKKQDPVSYHSQPAAKLLATIYRHIFEDIPKDPNSPEFRQGNTLGANNRHWFRAKFHARYRLFYRFSSQKKVIIYAWVNDESSLRKAGSKTDPYGVFRSMLVAGDPPGSFDDLLKASTSLKKT